MDNQEGQSSVNGEDGQYAGQGVPRAGENMDRLIEALTTFADRQTAAIMGHTVLLEKFKRLHPTEFEGTIDPSAADAWLKGVERVFRILEVPDEQKLRLAAFSLAGDALVWWENTERIHTTPVQGTELQPITWELFIREFRAKNYLMRYQLDREREFLTL